MLISHEIPKKLFPFHDYINNYPYLLAHLLLKEYHYDNEYAAFYKECLKNHSYSILDNSCFELGMPVETEHLVDLSFEYNVSHIVLPDMFRDSKATIRLAEENLPKLIGKVNSKLFAVVQGNSFKEMLDCYDFYNQIPEIDIIGINFLRVVNENNATRQMFFNHLFKERNVTKKIHFLGVETPYEFLTYTKEEKDKIFSVDTSNPIMSGWKGYSYKDKFDTNYVKPTEKLAENLDMELTTEEIAKIFTNVVIFKGFIGE